MLFNTLRNVYAVLGGIVVFDPKAGTWRTTYFDEADHAGVLGDYLRVEAAKVIHHHVDKNALFVSSGGEEDASCRRPPISRVIKQELTAGGIPPHQIVEESESGTTYQQLRNTEKMMVDIISKDPDSVGFVGYISNAYHIERISEMIERSDNSLYFLRRKQALGELGVLSAEAILLMHARKKWQPIINAAYRTSAMYERQKKERRGVEDLRTDRYQLRT